MDFILIASHLAMKHLFSTFSFSTLDFIRYYL